MTDTGWQLAGTGANNNDAGTTAWSNPGNVVASDDADASCTIKSGQTTRYLHATNFGSAVPAGATINGIEYRIERSNTGAAANVDHTIQSIKGGTRQGTNVADTGTSWPNTDTNRDYGSSAELYALSWSVADVNASDSGVAIRASASGTTTFTVDAVWRRVHYTEGGAGRMLLTFCEELRSWLTRLWSATSPTLAGELT